MLKLKYGFDKCYHLLIQHASTICLCVAATAVFPQRSHYSFILYFFWPMSTQLVSILLVHRLPAQIFSVAFFSVLCPVIFSRSPPHLATGPAAASLRWLIISCLSRDHLPSGTSRNYAVSEAVYWTFSQPTGKSDHLANNDSCSCQSGWAPPSIFLSVG